MTRTFYRIVRHPVASEEDFKPAKALDEPLRDARFRRQWAEGVSVHDTFAYAAAQARLYRYKLGRYVVAVRLPSDASAEVEQSGSDPHHYTLCGTPPGLLALAADPPRRVEED